jgi:hypothetical protein
VVERVLIALVANRALAPSSKLAATSWIAHDVHLPGLEQVSDDACYRALDWLDRCRARPRLEAMIAGSIGCRRRSGPSCAG